MARCSIFRNRNPILKCFSFWSSRSFSLLRFLGSLMLTLTTPIAEVALITVYEAAFVEGGCDNSWRATTRSASATTHANIKPGFINEYTILKEIHTARARRVSLQFHKKKIKCSLWFSFSWLTDLLDVRLVFLKVHFFLGHSYTLLSICVRYHNWHSWL